jgi:hypothetical protein
VIAAYVPFRIQSDEEVRKQLEAEILEQWFELDCTSEELPPDFELDPDLVERPWSPASVAQKMALECLADIILYGGSAGSLKSETLLVNASIEVDNPNYNGIIFRQSFPELRDLVKKSIKLYTKLGGKFTKGSPLCWRFPSGATIWMGYLGHDDDVFAHQGNEYSFIGFDEAGHQTEARIRYLLTRLRSTDPTLRLRMFLTANPGGPGHTMLMHMFLKDVCPHCQPKKAVEAGKLYYDATWKSDGQKLSVTLPSGRIVPMSVAFIPGKITDHNLLGEDYIAKLMMQAAATAKQLMDGCWKAWEGQFFDCFLETRGADADGNRLEGGPDMRMVVPRTDLSIEWWYPHVVSGDYGFSGSSASGHLAVRTPPEQYWPRGRLYILEEYCEKGKTAKDFANELLQRYFLEENPSAPSGWQVPEKPRSIQMWCVSPDAFRKDGSVNDLNVPFSRLEQMNEILNQWGFEFIRANDDRPGGWMRLYQMLRDGEVVICKHLKNTIDMLQTRLKDPLKNDDILKVRGDPLDDIADDLRYLVMTWDMGIIKPRDVRVAEAIVGMNPTNAMMTMRAIDIADRQVGQSVSFSPKPHRGRRGGSW